MTRSLLTAFALTLLVSGAGARQPDGGKAARPDFLTSRGVTSVTILPPVGEAVPGPVRSAASSTFVTELLKQSPGVRVTPPDEAAARLESAKRLDDFASFLNLFVKTGTINREALSRIVEAAGGGHLLLVDVQAYDERGGSWRRARSASNRARVQYSLFTPAGELVYQNLESYDRNQRWTKTAPMEEFMGRISERAVKSLLAGEQNTDPKSKKDSGKF